MPLTPTEYNYQDLVDRLTENLKEKEGWGDAYESSMGQTLIQMVADTTDILHYMQERRARESYLQTANMDSSIRALAAERGYRPRRNVSSSGFLKLRLVDSSGNLVNPEGTVFIPRYTKFFYDDLVFVNRDDLFVTSDNPEVTFFVMEGTPQLETHNPFDSSFFGETGYILYPEYNYIEENSFVIGDTGGDEWSDVRSKLTTTSYRGALSFAGGNEKYYDVKISVDGLRIVFGNGTFGASPTSTLTVEWVKSSGNDVIINTTGLPFRLQQNTLQDDINVFPRNNYFYEIENTTPIRGGLNAETIPEIKIKAPEYFKTGDRAVTRDDFDFWLIRSGIGGIVDVNSYGEQELGIDIFNMNHVFCSYITNTEEEMTEEQLNDAYAFIDQYKVGIPHVTFIPADKIYYQYNLKIARDRTLRVSNPEVYEYVREQIANRFKFENGAISRPMYYSDMVKFLQKLTIVRDGLEQDVARYIALSTSAVIPFEVPDDVYSSDVYLTFGEEGETYTITIDDVDYSYTVQLGDSIADLIAGLRTELDDAGFDTLSIPTNAGINITTTDDETSFNVSVSATNMTSIWIRRTIQLPPRFLYNRFNEDQLLRGSVDVVDSTGAVVVPGVIWNRNQFESNIDYMTGIINVPEPKEEGTYYVRYKEDEYDNIKSNERSVIAVLNPKAKLDPELSDTLSTIEFI